LGICAVSGLSYSCYNTPLEPNCTCLW